MGGGLFNDNDYKSYSHSRGRTYDDNTGRTSGQSFTQTKLDQSLNPLYFQIRECCNSDEHPNTIPVILGLDLTGSMGAACKECADALGVIMKSLYKKFKDIEFCIMGIGDLAYDRGSVQMSQFESDIRIAESLDKIWREGGGGGNGYESYSVAWYMGLKRTKLDCWKQGRKGIIITMGDEPMNPYLPYRKLNDYTNSNESRDVNTNSLYSEAKEKFDIFHIAIDDRDSCYSMYDSDIKNSFGQLLGKRLKVSTIQNLAKTIEECITESVGAGAMVTTTTAQAEPLNEEEESSEVKFNENGEITW